MAKNQKPIKIKRYRSTFGNTERNRRAKRMVIIVAALLLIFVAGFFLANPLIRFVKNIVQQRENESSVTTSSQGMSEEEPGENEDNTSQAEPPLQISEKPHAATVVDVGVLQSAESARATAKSLAEGGVLEAIVVLKNNKGELYYPSAVPMAAGAISQTQVNPAELVEIFQAEGVLLSANIYAYQDPAAAYAYREAAVHFRGQEGVLWLDNTIENGGKPWLNPYSEISQQYIVDLTKELSSFGFKRVIISMLQYPAVGSLDYTSYGASEGSMPKDEALRQVVEKLNTEANTQCIIVSFEYPQSAVQGVSLVSYEANPLTFHENSILITIPQQANGVLWNAGQLAQLIESAKTNNITDIGMRFMGYQANSPEFEELKQAALEAGCHWVVAG